MFIIIIANFSWQEGQNCNSQRPRGNKKGAAWLLLHVKTDKYQRL
jgi:hypothetical protein